MEENTFTHLGATGLPQMVDVSEKDRTKRKAQALAIVNPGKEILALIQGDELITKKGGVFQTAILAGVMGAKKTHELIPLCHPLFLEDCQVKITVRGDEIHIESEVTTTGKTGVEMEALTAVSVAALTLYDMCKALSHNILISSIRLLEKTGGKKDFKLPR